MSHGDHVDVPPPGYVVTATSANSPIAAFRHATKPIYGVQFHPEVAHTPRGGEIISNFLFERLSRASRAGRRARSSTSEVAKIRDAGRRRRA